MTANQLLGAGLALAALACFGAAAGKGGQERGRPLALGIALAIAAALFSGLSGSGDGSYFE